MSKSSVPFKNFEDGEEYGFVLSAKGNCRMECSMMDGSIVIAKIKGTLIKGRKKQKIVKDDCVLLQQDFSSSEKKYYIVYRYTPDEVKVLKKSGEIPKDRVVNTDNSTPFNFEDQAEDEEVKKEEINFEDL